MAHVIRVRDVARLGIYELGPDEFVLRGAYELFHPVGPVRKRGELVDWVQGTVIRSARTVPARLGETHPGERVLLKLPPLDSGRTEDEWWLCEVEAVDGIEAAL
jgi:hypothetical protein